MAIGREGTLCVKAKRVVGKGGTIRYLGSTFQHDSLLPFVGKEVLIWEEQTRHLRYRSGIYECEYERIYAAYSYRKRQHRTNVGAWICDMPDSLGEYRSYSLPVVVK